ncbi:MAG: rhomboid family intramembrane serine protease [Pelagimonas sp.]
MTQSPFEPQEPAVNPMPPVVVALFLVLLGFEAMFALGQYGIIGGPNGIGWRNLMIEKFAFSDKVFDWMLTTGQFPAEHLIRFVTYPFVHATLTHGIMAMVIMLALGKIVAEALGTFAFLTIWIVSSVAGAAAYGLLTDDPRLLFGAYPPAYGMIGGFTYLMWVRLGALGAPQVRAFSLIGFLLGIQLLFSLLFGGDNSWVAEIAGFVTGFIGAVILVPGGMAQLIQKLRRD